MPIETRAGRNACRGLTLQPTRSKPGKFRRLGQINRTADNLEALLKTAMKSELLGKDLYLKFDQGKGFTIEI
jgi:hypothetical protein